MKDRKTASSPPIDLETLAEHDRDCFIITGTIRAGYDEWWTPAKVTVCHVPPLYLFLKEVDFRCV